MIKLPRRLLTTALLASVSLSATAFVLDGPKWQDNEITIHYVPIVAGAPTAGVEIWNTAMSKALDSWSIGVPNLSITKTALSANPCAGTSQTTTSGTTTTTTSTPADGNLKGVSFSSTICGTEFGASTLAVNISVAQGGFYINSDVIFNSARVWDLYSGPMRTDVLDFKRVAVHELGHLLGLDHETLQSAGGQPAIMAPIYGNIELPTPDDLAGLNALYSSANSPMKVSLEEPSNNQVASGVSNIRGWAVADSGIDRVEIYIDNVLQGNSPYGSERTDVGAAYPTRPNATNSGFALTINWSTLYEGPHTVVARAYDNLGHISTSSGLAIVEKFDTDFISSADLVKLAGSITTNGNVIQLDNVMVSGKPYRIDLKWNTASQQFDITNIINLF